MLINVKMPIVGTLTFMSMDKFCAQLSWAWKTFITSRPGHLVGFVIQLPSWEYVYIWAGTWDLIHITSTSSESSDLPTHTQARVLTCLHIHSLTRATQNMKIDEDSRPNFRDLYLSWIRQHGGLGEAFAYVCSGFIQASMSKIQGLFKDF